MDPGLIALGAMMLLGGGGAAAATARRQDAADEAVDGARLVARANATATKPWIDRFVRGGAPRPLAEALARWAGIESTGNPLAVSRLGERGLMQISEQEALKEKPPALTWSEWIDMTRKETPPEQHARIAQQVASWEWTKAKKHIQDAPADFTSGIWYAKLYHQRPVDVRDGKMHGPALPMAHELAVRWAGDAAKMHRLRAANVVAWGVPKP